MSDLLFYNSHRGILETIHILDFSSSQTMQEPRSPVSTILPSSKYACIFMYFNTTDMFQLSEDTMLFYSQHSLRSARVSIMPLLLCPPAFLTFQQGSPFFCLKISPPVFLPVTCIGSEQLQSLFCLPVGRTLLPGRGSKLALIPLSHEGSNISRSPGSPVSAETRAIQITVALRGTCFFLKHSFSSVCLWFS